MLYDSVERDGGATAAYVFWVLDLLGHTRKMVLERGIDAWEEAGYDLDSWRSRSMNFRSKACRPNRAGSPHSRPPKRAAQTNPKAHPPASAPRAAMFLAGGDQ